MRLLGLLALCAGLGATSAAAFAADSLETGVIVGRVQGGYWARFAHPVQENASAQVRAFAEGGTVGTARITWCAPVPPYEAFIVEVKPLAGLRSVSSLTPYQVVFDSSRADTFDEPPAITSGFFVAAPKAKPAPRGEAVDPVRATVGLLADRPDVRERIETRERDRTGEFARRRIASLAADRNVVWRDPITARLFQRLDDLLRARGEVGGEVPWTWFPAELARQRSSGASSTAVP